jgi:hypothetical protein
MSVLVRFAPPSATTEQYDEVIRRLEALGDWPPFEYHVAFKVGDQLRVSEIWESQEKFQAFGEKLMPVLGEIGIDPGQPEVLEIHNIIQP